jgi:putative ABC transport system permease protein
MATMNHLAGRLRALWRVLTRSRQLERDMHDEMKFHVEMEADRLVRVEGVDPVEARRQANVRFGGVETYKEAGRDARGRRWLDALIVDSRLGARMLLKYKGLTLVGGLAMAVAIGIGATAYEVFGEMLSAALPFDEGDRVVSVEYDSERPDGRNPMLDLFEAKDQLNSLDDVAAFRTISHNLIAPPLTTTAISIAQISAAGLALTRVRPLHGRLLLDSDEDRASPPVLLISFRAWNKEFAADPNVVGQEVSLSGVAHTIVGVMPEGFAFPIDHQYWLPLSTDSVGRSRDSGSTMYAFGRLAAGVSLEQADAELTALSQRYPSRGAAESTDQADSQVSVVPYTHRHVDLSDPALINVVRLARLVTGALAFIVAINLAILFHARTVTRAGELAVRTALGASRARLLAQLYLEALALALVGATAGLLVSGMVLQYIQTFARAAGRVPFWIRFDLSPSTIVNAFVLAALTALIVGVVPGLKATGRQVTAALGGLDGGRTAPRLGRVWTGMVVMQVAAAVAVLPVACFVTWQTLQMEFMGLGFDAHKFVVARIALPDDEAPADEGRVTEDLRQVMTRLRAEPGVAAVTFSTYLPGFAGGAQIEFDDKKQVVAPAPWYVSRLDVADDMLDIYGATVLAGRTFNAGDISAPGAVVVNESFTRWLPQGVNPLGAKFRYVADFGSGGAVDTSLFEIVGVVRDLPHTPEAVNLDTPAVVFHPAALGSVHPVFLSLRYDGQMPSDAIEHRIREVSSAVDPALQVRNVQLLTRYYETVRGLWRMITWSAAIATLSGLLLSAAGMYALMSFAVAQRTREIGIRVALGARPRRLFLSIFGRAFRQLALGIVVGWAMAAVAIALVGLDVWAAVGLLAAVAVIMLVVGLLAAIGPARRSLRVHAAEALRG